MSVRATELAVLLVVAIISKRSKPNLAIIIDLKEPSEVQQSSGSHPIIEQVKFLFLRSLLFTGLLDALTLSLSSG